MILTYLFTATYPDGSVFTQNPEDTSAIDPKRSAFYDLMQRGEPAAFTLTGNGHTYAVDLVTGEFTTTGPHEWIERDALPEQASEYRLVYYRRHRHHFKAGSTQEIGHEVMYCMGWQTTVNGENYQQVIGIS